MRLALVKKKFFVRTAAVTPQGTLPLPPAALSAPWQQLPSCRDGPPLQLYLWQVLLLPAFFYFCSLYACAAVESIAADSQDSLGGRCGSLAAVGWLVANLQAVACCLHSCGGDLCCWV